MDGRDTAGLLHRVGELVGKEPPGHDHPDISQVVASVSDGDLDCG